MSGLEHVEDASIGLLVRGEHVLHVFLKGVVIQLSPLFDLSRHLRVDLLDVFGRAVRVFE